MNISKFHDKHYKTLLLIPLILIIFSITYLGIFYSNNGDIFYKDITLTGGTAITVYEKVNLNNLESKLSSKLADLNTREVYDLTTREQKAVILETTTDGEQAKQVLEDYLGYKLIEGENSDFEFTGSTLSKSF